MSFNTKKIILIFLFVLYLFSLTSVPGNPVNNQVSLQPQHQMEPTKCYQKIRNSYTDIDPIYITSNNSFTPEGFSGSGTDIDPYILENCRITNNTEPNLIWIINTDAYFIIRNNFIDGINKSPTGIYLSKVTNGVVEKNTIINTNQAIHSAWNSNNNVITNNTIKDNNDGIAASYSHNSSYTNNYIFNNTRAGINFVELFQQASRSFSRNIISNNTIYDNGEYGIYIACGTNNLIMNNSVVNNGGGIKILGGEQNTIYNNRIIGNTGGLSITNGFRDDVFILCASSNISRNTIMHNGGGINLWGDFIGEGTHNISKNIIGQNNDSLNVYSSNYTITENIIFNNDDVGIYIDGDFSIVKSNDFIGNLLLVNYPPDSQAVDSGSNNIFSKNYWDDWTCPDADADGIVDNPYPLLGGYDASPLTSPHNDLLANLHLLSRPRILYPKESGDEFKGSITVKWCSVTDFSGHSVSYTLYYSNYKKGPWEELATDLTTTEYEWDTTTVENDYDYFLKVVAECSEGLTSEYSLISGDSFEIKNPEATHGWSFAMLILTLCLIVFASRKKKSK